MWLIFFTLIGGCLRFVSLDRPTIWGDEAATYARISGDYSDLLEQLSDRSIFTPIHYELLWWIKQGMPLWGRIVEHEFVPSHQLIPGGVLMTPFMLRLVPAIAGTLFIPAFYFLSRQISGPRQSLLAAMLATCSAFLMVYSRDAKMYMPFWLFLVLNMSFFLWWLRTRTVTPWLAWIFTGILMIGFHALGRAMIAVQAMMVLTSPGQHWLTWFRILMSPRGPNPWRAFRLPLMVIFATGALAMIYPSVVYYQYFNKQMDVVTEEGVVNTSAAGVEWVEKYNDGRSFGDLVMYTTTSFLSGWEWPQVYDNPFADKRGIADPMILKLLTGANIALLCLLATGLVPWRKLLNPSRAIVQSFRQDQYVSRVFVHRRILWIVTWICVVPYAMYYVAERHPVTLLDGVAQFALKSPPSLDWPRLDSKPAEMTTLEYLSASQLWKNYFSKWPTAWDKYSAAFNRENLHFYRLIIFNILLLMLVAITGLRIRWIGRGVIQVLFTLGLLVVICGLVSLAPYSIRTSIWMPRYIAFILPAVLLASAMLISQQPVRWMKFLTLFIFIAVNLGQYAGRVWGHTEPPVDRMALDLVASQPRSIVSTNPAIQTYRTYTQFNRVSGPAPGFGVLNNQAGNYYIWLYSQVKATPWQLRRADVMRLVNYWDDSVNIQQNLKSSPGILRFSAWTVAPMEEFVSPDKLAEQLKGSYRCVSEEYFPCRDHWTWRKTFTLIRREYVKVNPGLY